MACFADINVSQGSVATYARCDGILNIHLTANLLRNLPVKKKFCKSVKIWQNYVHESVGARFWPTLYVPMFKFCTDASHQIFEMGGLLEL